MQSDDVDDNVMKDFVDDLFRRVSEDPDIPFNEQAWDRMEHKLDYSERKRRRGLFWLLFFLFFTIGIGLLWSSGYWGSTPESTLPKHDGPVAGEPSRKEKIDQSKKGRKTVDKADQLVEAGGLNSSSKKGPHQKNIDQILPHSGYSNENPTRSFPPDQKRSRQLSRTGKTAPSIIDYKPHLQEEKLADFSRPKEEGSIDSVKKAHNLWETLGAIPMTSFFVESTLEPLDVELNNELFPVIQPVPVAKSWGLGLSAGPDLASVNGNGSTAYGLNAGLAFDYRVGKRWVFQASGQYLLKNYIADQKEYVAPKGFWPTRSYPISTEGTCDMLQWSVDLRYNWLAKPKFKSFVSLGSSSWTILNEKYEFYYAKNYPGLLKHWSSSQDKSYWLSMAQMGIGIEKMIRPGLSLQLNWFAQMPLQGVGNGKVEIYSSGLGFMVHKQMGKLKK